MTHYSLRIDQAVSELISSFPAEPHDLLVLACLDLQLNPYGLGRVVKRVGSVTTLTHDLAGLGLVVFDVDEEPEPPVITVTDVITLL